jgi:sugar fermentation stimulation protein A
MSNLPSDESSLLNPSERLLSHPGRLSQPLVPARFRQRLHRFALEMSLDSAPEIPLVAHMADPGRLTHLLQPGRRLWVEGPFEQRKTPYSAILAELENGVCVSLVTTLTNKMFPLLLAQGRLPLFQQEGSSSPEIRREVTHGGSRFDFVLNDGIREWWIECKSVTWQVEGTGWFPDAPTTRGTKHLRELTEMAKAGISTAVMLIAQREDIFRIAPAEHIDPDFAEALKAAWRAGVELLGVGVRITPGGVWFQRELPIVWHRHQMRTST